MKKVVFDIGNKQYFFSEVGTNNPADLSISVVGVYEYEKDLYSSFLVEEFNKLWSIIENADALITFNGETF